MIQPGIGSRHSRLWLLYTQALLLKCWTLLRVLVAFVMVWKYKWVGEEERWKTKKLEEMFYEYLIRCDSITGVFRSLIRSDYKDYVIEKMTRFHDYNFFTCIWLCLQCSSLEFMINLIVLLLNIYCNRYVGKFPDRDPRTLK